MQGRTLEQVLQRTDFLRRVTLRSSVATCGGVRRRARSRAAVPDIKAQNVMCDATGRHVLMDFGAGDARARFSSATSQERRSPRAELLNGDPASRQSDIYGVGVLLHFATGRDRSKAARCRTCAPGTLRLTSRAFHRCVRDKIPESAREGDRACPERTSIGSFDYRSCHGRGRLPHRRWPPPSNEEKAAGVGRCLRSRAAGDRDRDSAVSARRNTATASSEVRARLLWDDATDTGGHDERGRRLLSFTDWTTAISPSAISSPGRPRRWVDVRPRTSVERSRPVS